MRWFRKRINLTPICGEIVMLAQDRRFLPTKNHPDGDPQQMVIATRTADTDRKSTRLNSSHS